MFSNLACASIQLITAPDKNLILVAYGTWKDGNFTEDEAEAPNRSYVGLSEEDLILPHIQAFATAMPVYHVLKTKDYLMVSFSQPDTDEISTIGFSYNSAPNPEIEIYVEITKYVIQNLVVKMDN